MTSVKHTYHCSHAQPARASGARSALHKTRHRPQTARVTRVPYQCHRPQNCHNIACTCKHPESAPCIIENLHQAAAQGPRTLRFLLIAELDMLGKVRQAHVQGCAARR